METGRYENPYTKREIVGTNNGGVFWGKQDERPGYRQAGLFTLLIICSV